jgi:2-phosphoglycerate kinase
MVANNVYVTKHEENHKFKIFLLPKNLTSMKRTQKYNKRLMIETIIGETKREGQRKAKRYTTFRNQKNRRELILFMVGSVLTHGPSNVANMKIVRLNNNGRFRTNMTCQCNFLLYSKS